METMSVEAAFAELLVADPAVADRDEVAVDRSPVIAVAVVVGVDRCPLRATHLRTRGRPVSPSRPNHCSVTRATARPVTPSVSPAAPMRAMRCRRSRRRLAAGVISGDHVDAVARVLRGLDDEIRAEFISHEAALLVAACRERIVMFDRTCRDLAKCLTAERDRRTGVDTEAAEFERQRAAAKVRGWVDKDTGMHHTHVELDPERGTRLADVLRVHLRRIVKQDGNSGRPYSQLEVDAFMAALESGVTHRPTAGGTGSGNSESGLEVVEASAEYRVPDVTLLIDHHTLHNGHHEHGICETSAGIPLPVETARRLCCDAEITLASVDANGVVRNLGRTQRTVNRAQRRELRAMHRTCVGRGCQVPFDQCQIHHVRVLAQQRSYEHRKSGSRLQPAPPSRSRRWLDTHDDTRAGHHLDPTRRNHRLPRHFHRPGTQRRPTTRNRSARDGPTR